MIKSIQSGQNVNLVFSLFDNLLVKKYINSDRKRREIVGIKAWSKNKLRAVPIRYFSLGQTVLFELIKTQNVDKGTIFKSLVETYVSVMHSFQYHKHITHEDYKNWNVYLSQVLAGFKQNKSLIKSLLNRDEFVVLEQLVKCIKKIDWSVYPKAPLHRDLHWGNILTTGEEIKIIDFEHHCIGPIEYEFCNSLFWNDKLSLNFANICEEFNKHGFQINKKVAHQLVSLYFIEQVMLANFSDDKEKLNLLSRKMKDFVARNKQILIEIEQPNSYFI